MFEVMWNYKAWDKFEKWFLKKYKMYPHQTEKDFVLFTIPFFMDEQNIFITIEAVLYEITPRQLLYYYNIDGYNILPITGKINVETRKEALIKASETAFEILEGK